MSTTSNEIKINAINTNKIQIIMKTIFKSLCFTIKKNLKEMDEYTYMFMYIPTKS